MIEFQEDKTNLNYRSFEILSNNPLKIKMLGVQMVNFNHCNTLPSKGIFYFKVKIIQSNQTNICLGICEKSIKSLVYSCRSPLFMGLFIGNGCIYHDNKKEVVLPDLSDNIDSSSILKLSINMKNKELRWYLNDGLIYRTWMQK
jgi:hypothetical protein